ncbi:MAG: hypothetical protein SOT82_03500, partial [Oscillospiraceae bacterium]|nr:hypothetical protein [Oscillospiraceae bacterium]
FCCVNGNQEIQSNFPNAILAAKLNQVLMRRAQWDPLPYQRKLVFNGPPKRRISADADAASAEAQ